MSSIEDICNSEFIKLIDSEIFSKDFFKDNEVEMKKIFNYIFIINYFKNRAETKTYFNDNFKMTFSLILESSFALYTGQCRAALLLLRSAQETNFKFVLERERESILQTDPSKSFEKLDYRFTDTKRKFLKDIEGFVSKTDFSEYYCTIERNLTLYKKLCGIVHSESTNIPVFNVNYYSNLYKDTILSKDDYFKLYTKTLNELFALIFFMLRDRLKQWDTYNLYDLLHLVYGSKKTKRYVSIVKK